MKRIAELIPTTLQCLEFSSAKYCVYNMFSAFYNFRVTNTFQTKSFILRFRVHYNGIIASKVFRFCMTRLKNDITEKWAMACSIESSLFTKLVVILNFASTALSYFGIFGDFMFSHSGGIRESSLKKSAFSIFFLSCSDILPNAPGL